MTDKTHTKTVCSLKNQDAYAASFNLADAIYKQEQYEESTPLFRALAEKTDNKIDKSKNYHNLGNSLLKEQKLTKPLRLIKTR